MVTVSESPRSVTQMIAGRAQMSPHSPRCTTSFIYDLAFHQLRRSSFLASHSGRKQRSEQEVQGQVAVVAGRTQTLGRSKLKQRNNTYYDGKVLAV
jgi:hypothetical protein